MSAFGYLAFVVSVINAVANAANNINNNQASLGPRKIGIRNL